MRIDRRGFVKAAIAGPALMGAQPGKPNVLFVLTDEWRAQAFGYAGDANARTPSIDRFAAESVNFENAVSGHPVCCPYRGSLLTGQYPLTNGLFINDEELKPRGTTMGEAFRQAGYQTGYVGKWHVYGSPDGKYGRRLAYIPPDRRFGFQYWKACECTHDYNHSLYYEGDDPTPKYWPGYDAIAQTDDACRYIQQRSKAPDPFFLVLSLGPPHFPLNTAPERYQAMYRDREIKLRPNVPESAREAATRDLRGYYSHIAAVDDCFSRLLGTLDNAGIAQRTIVVFTSDHGDMMRSHGLLTKHVPWEESIRVPFLVRYPQRSGTKARRVKTVLNTPDIMPTLLGLAGVRVPNGVQGANYSGVCRGDAPPRDSAAFLQFPVSYGQARTQGIGEYRGLRTERYTYVRSRRGPWLLYDNQADPYQMHNLCARSEQKSLTARLDRDLDGQLKAANDEFLPGHEYINRFGYGRNGEIALKAGHVVSPWGDWEATL